MPYYDTIAEDLKRAHEILVKGKADHDLPGAVGGTIYGADTYAAYRLLESFVTEIEGMQARVGRDRKPWRVGRKVGRTIYEQQGDTPSDTELLIGVMDTRELAAAAVEAHNQQLDLTALREAIAKVNLRAVRVIVEQSMRQGDGGEVLDQLLGVLDAARMFCAGRKTNV